MKKKRSKKSQDLTRGERLTVIIIVVVCVTASIAALAIRGARDIGSYRVYPRPLPPQGMVAPR